MEHPFVLNSYFNAFELSFPIIAMGVAKMFTHFLKNKKVTKTLKPNNIDIAEIIEKLEQVKKIHELLKINADQINMLLNSARSLQQKDEDISDNLFKFI